MELPFFALRRFDERRDFLLPPFFADAFLREERLFGAMVRSTSRLPIRDNCDLQGETRTHQKCAALKYRDVTGRKTRARIHGYFTLSHYEANPSGLCGRRN